MKISIIMPTFNDDKLITESINSVIAQSYKNWELIIVDDGSSDSTKNVVEKIIKENKNCDIRYFYQDNQDQLNEINNYADVLTGEYVYILHSDDLFYDDFVIDNFIREVQINNDFDAYYTDLELIDKNGVSIGVQSVLYFKTWYNYLPLTLLWLGRNLIVDFALMKKDVFLEKIRKSYLMWNMPFWIDLSNEKLSQLNLKKLNIKTRKYRVFEENYINSEIGLQNVINGELRTLITIMTEYAIPFYKVQYFIYRVFVKLKTNHVYCPLYFYKPQRNKHKIIDFVIKKRFRDGYKENLYLYSLYLFYKNKSSRIINLKKISNDVIIYKGKDMRAFNNALMNGCLNNFYLDLFSEMKQGFGTIIVSDVIEKEKIENLSKFLCLEVEVIVDEK